MKKQNAVIDRFWLRMAGIWGYKWTSQYGAVADHSGDWADALLNLTMEEINRGIEAEKNSGETWPSPVPVFKRNCSLVNDDYITGMTSLCIYWHVVGELEKRGLTKSKEAFYVYSNCYHEITLCTFEQAKKIVAKSIDQMIRAIDGGYELPELPDPNVKQVGYVRVKVEVSFMDILKSAKESEDQGFTYQDLRALRRVEVPV